MWGEIMATTQSFHVNDYYYDPTTTLPITDYKFTMTLLNVTPLTQEYWAFDWWFNDSANTNGYTGVQPISDLAGGGTAPAINASVWNATSATPGPGSTAATFGNEGTGMRITHQTPVVTGVSYTFEVSIANGVLTETVTDQSGNKTVIGSFPAPANAFSTALGFNVFMEYYGQQNSATLAPGEMQISNVLVNGQANAINFNQGFHLHDPAVAADSLPIIEAWGPGGYYNTSTGPTGANLTLILENTQANVTGGVDTNTVKIAAGYNNLLQDSFTNIQNLDGGGQTLTLTAAQLRGFSSVINASLVVSGGAADIAAALDQLESFAAAGTLVSDTLTGGGIPTLSVTAAQLSNDALALKGLSGYFTLSIAAMGSNLAIAGLAGHGNVVQFSGASSQYAVTSGGDGSSFTVTQSGSTDHLSGITALQFTDGTDFVASQTAPAGGVSSVQIADLYAAVLARTPDIAGLAYYQQQAQTSPQVSITTYTEYFLSSPEYTGNSAHNYAQTAQGEAGFITDTYSNLLHRAPENGAVAYYQNVISQFTNNLTPGTAAYAAADLLAHATVLTFFSQSAEFLGDVQITAAHPADAQHWLYLI